jgi:ABC-type nitrate/sulfonate/bicarbonate transport system ATPase subunit
VTPPAIGVRNLRLALPGRDGPLPVLGGVTFDVPAGGFVALVGTSGCGKSTLLDVLAGLRAPDAGEVRIDGDPGAKRLGRLTLMPQRDALMPWRTTVDNVAVGAELSGLAKPEARRAARAALGRYGLGGFEDHYPHALSGGMRQRAALARTLLAGRAAWLLDEPFGAVDALTRADLVAMLEALWTEHRPTTVLVTHDLDEALVLADRVLVLTARPAQVADEIEVDLPRPRAPVAAGSPVLGALKRRLLETLRAAGALA